MSKKILIVGLGIGSMYREILKNSYKIETIDFDSSKNPTFTSIAEFKEKRYGTKYDLIIICTPNFLHKEHFLLLREYGRRFVVEKPGFKNTKEFQELYNKEKNIFIMKNNYYRDEIINLKPYMKNTKKVSINWINENRIPQPGGWFTDISKSFGGVSVDLMPHLLHIFFLLNDKKEYTFFLFDKIRNFSLSEIKETEYGKVNLEGVYNVDDSCSLFMNNDSTSFTLNAAWANKEKIEDLSITLLLENGEKIIYKYSLCPEKYYYNYLSAIAKGDFDSIERKTEQYNLDLQLHRILDLIKNEDITLF
jgi:predicted dehydrogenase